MSPKTRPAKPLGPYRLLTDEHVIDAVFLTPLHRHWAAITTVAPERDAAVGPGFADVTHEAAQMRAHFDAARRFGLGASLPPSKAAVTFFAPTAGNENYPRSWRAGLSSNARRIGISNQILRYINAIDCNSQAPPLDSAFSERESGVLSPPASALVD